MNVIEYLKQEIYELEVANKTLQEYIFNRNQLNDRDSQRIEENLETINGLFRIVNENDVRKSLKHKE